MNGFSYHKKNSQCDYFQQGLLFSLRTSIQLPFSAQKITNGLSFRITDKHQFNCPFQHRK